MLKILHTADWHLGRSFNQFEPEDARKLARDRLEVIERILRLAEQYDVDAVLCAGDLFDSPDPGKDWWDGLKQTFLRQINWTRPVWLLPGNHDPLTDESVYHPSHPFRSKLPEWVHIVDREDEFKLPKDAMLYAAPCTSRAGDKDLAMSLPKRKTDDRGIRIGLVHGSTFDMDGYLTNFPVSREAPAACGLDYLAIGDWHSFREIPEGALAPIVYPGAPEPTSFTEHDAGYVALVWFKRHGSRPRIQRERVARWTWRDVTVQSIVQLRALAVEDLVSTVLRLRLDLTASIVELDEIDKILSSLKGTVSMHARAGAFLYERTNLRLQAGDIDVVGMPETIRRTAERLSIEAKTDEEAKRALIILQRRLHEVQ